MKSPVMSAEATWSATSPKYPNVDKKTFKGETVRLVQAVTDPNVKAMLVDAKKNIWKLMNGDTELERSKDFGEDEMIFGFPADRWEGVQFTVISPGGGALAAGDGDASKGIEALVLFGHSSHTRTYVPRNTLMTFHSFAHGGALLPMSAAKAFMERLYDGVVQSTIHCVDEGFDIAYTLSSVPQHYFNHTISQLECLQFSGRWLFEKGIPPRKIDDPSQYTLGQGVEIIADDNLNVTHVVLRRGHKADPTSGRPSNCRQHQKSFVCCALPAAKTYSIPRL